MKIITFILILSILVFNSTFSQDRGNCKEIRNKEAKKIYNQAINVLNTKPKDAYELLLRVVEMEPRYVDAYYILADLNYLKAAKITDDMDNSDIKTRDQYYKTARIFFKSVIEICPSFNRYFAFFYVGQIDYKFKNYTIAKDNLTLFLKYNKVDFSSLEVARQMLQNIEDYLKLINNPVPFEPHIVEGICTEDDEFLPLFSPDGEYVFYTHRYKQKQPTSPADVNIEKFNTSKRINSIDSVIDIYETGTPMNFPFNDGRNQGAAAITIDNKHLFITICDYERANFTSYKNCDIFSSDFEEKKWTSLKRLGININGTNTFEGQPSITADGKELYFVTNREGGYGGLDIYRSVRDKNNEWGKAINLGLMINTAGDDKTPFIHSDSRTLYFASDGRLGLGGLDIYYSQQNFDSTWIEPKNIGYPINTAQDEVGLIVSANGKKIYFSSNTLAGKGGWDIFSAVLYKAARPEKVLFVKGKIIDDKGITVPNAKVELTNIQTKELTEGLVDKNTGDFAVVVPVKPRDEFILITKKDGYIYNSQYINPFDKKFEPPTTLNIHVTKIKTDVAYRLENVNFTYNTAILNDISKLVVDKLCEFLVENPKYNIELRGHTDNEGTAKYNMDLSIRRADVVKQYLISKRVTPQRIQSAGFGLTQPLTSNNSETGKAQNRRVEFILRLPAGGK